MNNGRQLPFAALVEPIQARFYSVFTSGAYRATAPNAAFPKKSRTSLPCPVQSRSENALQRFSNWCRPKRKNLSWFSLKQNHSSRSFWDHSNC